MAIDLTRMADYRGICFIKDEELAGKKYGLMREGTKVVRVSPAVFELIQDQPDALIDSLKIQILPLAKASRTRRRRGG